MPVRIQPGYGLNALLLGLLLVTVSPATGVQVSGWHFSDVSAGSGITTAYRLDTGKKPVEPRWICAGAAAADIDGDGFIDLYLAGGEPGSDVLLRNRGDGTFEDVTNDSGIEMSGRLACGPVFADIDADGKPDLIVPSVHGAPDHVGQPAVDIPAAYTRVFLNRGNRRFEMQPDNADFEFIDATEDSGVRQGYWGWGVCLEDFDNDGDLDIFHVNGFPAPEATEFHADPARMFLNDGSGQFTEVSASLGLDHPGQGRGVLCFDLDLDGDVDIIIINNDAPPVVLRNELAGNMGWLNIRLEDSAPNTAGIGARIEVLGPTGMQVREIRAGGAFVANGPAEAHFGFGAGVKAVSGVEVRWPSGAITVIGAVSVNRTLAIDADLIRREDFEPAGGAEPR